MTARIFFSYADRGSNSIEHARAPFLRARGGRTSPPVPSGDVRAMSSSADDLRGSASEPGAAVAPGTPSPFDRLPGEDVPDAGIAGDVATDPSVPPPATPSWFDASAFANPSFDAAAYVDDMSAYVSMDALRDELESYQKHLRNLLVDAVNADYDVFLSLGEGLVDVREVVDAQMAAPIEAFKRDVGATRAEIVELLNDLREKLRRRAECAERRATLELMLDANNVASKVERLLDQLDASGDDTTNLVASEPTTRVPAGKENKETTWTWEGPELLENENERSASDAKREDLKDADADADAAFESEVAAAAAAEVFSVAGTSVVGLDALHPGVAADGPSAAALALADEPSRASESLKKNASSRRASALRERCRLLERVAGEANRSRFFQTQGDEKNLAFVKGLKPRVERSEARLADAVAKAVAEACASRDAVAVARCLSAYVALGRAAEAERAIREARVAPAVAEALKRHEATLSEAQSDFAALLETCVDAALRSVDVELEVTSPKWRRRTETGTETDLKNSGGDDDVHAGATSSAANLDARVCVLGGCVLAEIDERVAAYAPGAYTPGAPDAFFKNHLAACAAIDALERALPPTRAALALFRASEPTLTFFKRWNVAAYFALRRREIVTRLDAELEEDRLTRAVAGAEDGDGTALSQAPPGAAFATAAAAGTYAALEKCFDAERVFLPRAADKFVKLAAQILARFGGWVVAGATSVAPAAPSVGAGREAPLAEAYDSASSGQADCERPGESGSLSLESLPPQDTPSVVSWGATASDEDLLRLRGDVEVLAARVETALAPRVAAALARTLGDAAAAAATEVLCDGAAALTRARDSDESLDESFKKTNVNARSAAESLDARLASDVVRRCAVALGQLKGVTATFRMTNKPMPTKPSHFANGVVEPLRRFAESGAVREASAPTRRALVDAAVAGVCAAYEKAAADLTVSVRKTEASLIRLKDRKGEKEKVSAAATSATASTAPGTRGGPTDAEKICRQVRLDAEAFGRAVARLGFDPEKSDAFAKLWEVCGEGDAFSSA